MNAPDSLKILINDLLDKQWEDILQSKTFYEVVYDTSFNQPCRIKVQFGTENIKGRDIVEHHLDLCLVAGLNMTGINAEVALGQWEFQVMGKGSLEACDQLILSRYLLNRLSETYGVSIEYHPKPLGNTDWNGSGMHTNFSTKLMREEGGKELFDEIFRVLKSNHQKHIEVYGSDNEKRLTGKHETQSIDKFSWGVSDRGASIRIPQSTVKNGWRGYLEDRRPASNACPYKIAKQLTESLKQAQQNILALQ
jgi:glutamine synthetase